MQACMGTLFGGSGRSKYMFAESHVAVSCKISIIPVRCNQISAYIQAAEWYEAVHKYLIKNTWNEK